MDAVASGCLNTAACKPISNWQNAVADVVGFFPSAKCDCALYSMFIAYAIVAGRPVKVPATGSSPSSSVGVLTGKGSVPLSGVLSATVYMGVCDALDKRDTANAMFRKLY